MDRSLLLTLVIVLSAALFQLSEAQKEGCKKPDPIPCSKIKPCKEKKMACLGPAGEMTCRKCKCNQTSQCELDPKNRLKCNCEKSVFKGEFCKCPPPSECNDVYLMSSYCTEFSKEYITVKNTVLPSVLKSYDADPSTAGECKDECEKRNCHVFSFGLGHCMIYRTTKGTEPFRTIMNEATYVFVSDVHTHIRACKKCYPYGEVDDHELEST